MTASVAAVATVSTATAGKPKSNPGPKPAVRASTKPQGKSGVARITKFNPEAFSTQIAAELKDYRAEDHFNSKDARKIEFFLKSKGFQRARKEKAKLLVLNGVGSNYVLLC